MLALKFDACLMQPPQYWPVPTYVICNSLTGVIVDSFLIHRFYTM